LVENARRILALGHERTAGPEVWDQVWAADNYGRAPERERRAARRLAELAGRGYHLCERMPLLDVGCGSGQTLKMLSRRCDSSDLFGIDFSQIAITSASRLLANRATLARADACALPFERESFSSITAFGVLEHIKDMSAALAEVARVLKPNGRLYLTTSNAASMQNMLRLLRPRGHYRYGFQQNLLHADVAARLATYFRVLDAWTVHGDWDRPLVALVDRALSMIGNRSVGRYVFATAEKANT
jgi:ubiquinone/menaquinone biosynthesis C-methylase UbiE